MKKIKNFRVFITIFLLLVTECVSFTWSSSINGIFTTRSISKNKNLLDSIASGAQMAMDECKNVFKWDRWNCPESAFSRRQRQLATRETAYTKAILSAGIVYAITRNCSRGDLEGCGCDPKRIGFTPNITTHSSDSTFLENVDEQKTKIDWSWGGCSDFPEYGEKIAKKILDNLEQGSDVQAYAHLHNNLAGRQIIRDRMIKRCKCHGVSGSCTIQTCWMEMVHFSETAKHLKEMYNKAIKIDFEKTGSGLSLGNSASNTKAGRIPKGNPSTLVYLTKSPNYCIPDMTVGWMGTKGRSCSRSRLDTASVSEKKSCKNICRACGLRVRKQKKQISYRCNCTFQWCCEVKCNTCTKTVEEFFCE